MNNEIYSVILAGGKGTRMNSDLPKPLHLIAEKPIIYWGLDCLQKANLKNIVVVVGENGEPIKKYINENFSDSLNIQFAFQEVQSGTATAALDGIKKVPENIENVLIVFADDAALYKPETLLNLIKVHTESKNKLTLLSLIAPTPKTIGGLDVDSDGNVVGVITKSEMERRGLTKNILLCGLLCVDRKWAVENIPNIPPSPLSGEFTLPTLIKISNEQGFKVGNFELKDLNQWNSINTQEELAEANAKKLKSL